MKTVILIMQVFHKENSVKKCIMKLFSCKNLIVAKMKSHIVFIKDEFPNAKIVFVVKTSKLWF